jgi:UDP-N-acetylglucosamine/UDP-N-acetylgalactosamine diphosphorylase
VLPLASHPLVVEARRDDEFCPLKNAEGDFSPEFVKGGLSRLHAGWLTQAGVDVPAGTRVEISPLYALDAAELKEKVDPSLQITGPLYLADAS